MRSIPILVLGMAFAAAPLAAQQSPCPMPCSGQQHQHGGPPGPGGQGGPCGGAQMEEMKKRHEAMQARMDSVNQVLTAQLAALKAAKGADRTAKLEAVVLTLAAEHQEMYQHMKGMEEKMGKGGGMGMGMGGMHGGPPPCAQPTDSGGQGN